MNNDLATTRQHKNMLFDFYGGLLTEKQREIYAMHHDDDCSLAEIGETMSVTPQAVADILKRADGKLNKYEEKLGMVQKYQVQQEQMIIVEDALTHVNSNENITIIRNALEKMML